MSEPLEGWLLYKRSDAAKNKGFIEMLIEEAQRLHLSLKLVFEEDLLLGVVNNKLVIHHPHFDLNRISFAIIRTINPLLTKQLENQGIPCFNNSFVSEVCNDKALTYQFIANLGIPILDTSFISHSSYQPGQMPSEFPLVLKQADGRGGKEVYLVHSPEDVASKLSENPTKRFVLQALCDNPGKDIRVFVIGGNVIGAVLRQSKTSFKANYTLGGTVAPYELKQSELELVRKISSAIGGDFIGIDFLVNMKNDLVFNEIEDVVGCRSLYATSNVNAAELYMKYIKNKL